MNTIWKLKHKAREATIRYCKQQFGYGPSITEITQQVHHLFYYGIDKAKELPVSETELKNFIIDTIMNFCKEQYKYQLATLIYLEKFKLKSNPSQPLPLP